MSKQEKAFYSAFDTALYYLTFRDRTRKEIQDKLKEKGYSDSEVDDAVSKLLMYGYLDDENYALCYIKSHGRKKGGRLISMELKNKGIEPQVARVLMDEIGLDECASIQAILEHRYCNADLRDDGQKRRIVAYFQRRGFQYENIRKVLSLFGENREI